MLSIVTGNSWCLLLDSRDSLHALRKTELLPNAFAAVCTLIFFLCVRAMPRHRVVLRRESTATDGLPTWLMYQIEPGWSLDYITARN